MRDRFNYLIHLPENISKNSKIIIMLHGVGSNADDLFKLSSHFENDYVFSLNGLHDLGGKRYAWYHMRYTDGRIPIYNGDEIDVGYRYIVDFIGYVREEYSLGDIELYLLGFSQGSNMSHYLYGKSPELVSGIIALSGRFLKETADLIINSNLYYNKKVFIGHGTSDSVIPVDVVKDLEEYINKSGINPVVKIYEDMPHTIIEEEMRDVVEFLSM